MAFRPKPPADNELCVRVASRIREARIAAGLTALQVVEASGLSRSTYYVYETAEGSFQITALAKIAPVIGCTLSELLMSDREVQSRLIADTTVGVIELLGSILDSHRSKLTAHDLPTDPLRDWRQFLATKKPFVTDAMDQPS